MSLLNPFKLFRKKKNKNSTSTNVTRISISKNKPKQFEENNSTNNNTSSDVSRISSSSIDNFEENNLNYVSRISSSSRENNFNANRPRNRITLENVKNNLPVLYQIHKKGLVGSNFGTVYIYKNPKIYNFENTMRNSKINSNNKILWEYYMLNNFLFTIDLFHKEHMQSSSSTSTSTEDFYVYPLRIYPFKESMEELNRELNLNENTQLEENFLKLQNNRNLLEKKIREKSELELKLNKINKNINNSNIKLKLITLTSNINILEQNINSKNKELKQRKIIHNRDRKIVNLNKSMILLSKKKFKQDKLKEYLETYIQPVEDRLKNEALISQLEKNIDILTIKKNELETKIEELEHIILAFEMLESLNKKAKFIKKLLELIKLNALENTMYRLKEFKTQYNKDLNFYAKEEEILENKNNNIMVTLSKKITNLNENSNNEYLRSDLEDLQTKLYEELKLIEAKIYDKKNLINIFNRNHNGGFVDPFSGTIVAILSFITLLYIHFLFIIKLFANYILVACSIEMKNSTRTDVIKSFIRTNFKDLFITYILAITFTSIGPLGVILNHVILFGITKYITSKSLNKGSKTISKITKSEEKFNKTLNFLCEKGKSKGIIATIKNTAIQQVNAKKFQLRCLAKSVGLINNKNNSSVEIENTNEDLDLYRLILVSKENNIYTFHIINLVDDTFYGYIEATADIVEKIYYTRHKTVTTITKEKENEILKSVNIFTGHVNENFSNFIQFLRTYYNPQKK
jgi:hypothetical protein